MLDNGTALGTCHLKLLMTQPAQVKKDFHLVVVTRKKGANRGVISLCTLLPSAA